MVLEDFGYKQELKRSLSLADLVIYGMIFMIPIAPFGVYGFVNQEAPGMVPRAYIIGMVAMLFTALSYGSMARAFPIAGSVYSYAQRGLNPAHVRGGGFAEIHDLHIHPHCPRRRGPG